VVAVDLPPDRVVLHDGSGMPGAGYEGTGDTSAWSAAWSWRLFREGKSRHPACICRFLRWTHG
jgi:hypothetical protein